jgi:hypothetical protein
MTTCIVCRAPQSQAPPTYEATTLITPITFAASGDAPISFISDIKKPSSRRSS